MYTLLYYYVELAFCLLL